MSREMAALLELTAQLGRCATLEEMLQRLVDAAALALSVDRVSVRMLDASGQRLLVGARAGQPLHDLSISFTKGEGLVGWVAEHGRALRLGDAESDPRFVERPSRNAELGSFLGVPLLDGDSPVGVLSATHDRLDYFTEDHEAELGVMAALCAPHLCIARLRRLSEVDPLTGALNRRGLDACFPEGPDSKVGGDAATEAFDENAGLSVVLLDIDHFKDVNDTFGHDVGDLALLALTNVLASVSRKGDAVVRLGGEEFVLVLPGATAQAATRVAERVRQAVASHRIVCEKGTVQFTVSAGVAERRPGETREELLHRADEAMYEAKGLGRDRVRVSELPGPPSQ
jgi:diguanylate cyclase (GGDEF)-like protein